MKYLILFVLLLSNLVLADECKMRSASQLANEREVGPITDLVKIKTYGKCVVVFNITVDGVTHRLQETETGMEQEESLCYYARERARKNLLLDLGGKFSTEAVTICKEGTTTIQKIKKGDHILENEVGKSKINKYFTYNNARCRMFTERNDFKGTLAVYHGVICQIDNSDTNWLVVDKW
jgi:hypothetical protein